MTKETAQNLANIPLRELCKNIFKYYILTRVISIYYIFTDSQSPRSITGYFNKTFDIYQYNICKKDLVVLFTGVTKVTKQSQVAYFF